MAIGFSGNPSNDRFDSRDDSQKPIRLAAQIQRAEKSSVFWERRLGRALARLMPHQSNLIGTSESGPAKLTLHVPLPWLQLGYTRITCLSGVGDL
jgi:hypothetical protein